MKTLVQFIRESDERDNLQFKVDTWLRSRPEEKKLWDAACRSWNETHQLDDDAIRRYMDNTDVKEFVNFINDGKEDPNADDYETVKNTIMNLQ